MKVETLILKNLLLTEDYPRRVLPFVKQEYFEDRTDQYLFDVIHKYFVKYSAVPTVEALTIEVGKISTLSDDQFKQIHQTLESFDKEKTELDWLLDTTCLLYTSDAADDGEVVPRPCDLSCVDGINQDSRWF